jgi:protein-S-isoprenylcysteine O-methyltransferase Ste14/uncharacterized membrane protein (UPF0127 family)
MHRATAGGLLLADRLRPAHTHWTRLRGLLGTSELAHGEGLWIRPSNQVHMFGMRYALDLVFLDGAGQVIRLIRGLAPNRVSPRVAGAASVLELPVGTIDGAALSEGDRVEINGSAESGQRIQLDVLGTLLTNLTLALLYAFFVAAHVGRALDTGEWATTMPLVVQEALLVVLFLTRRRSLATSSRPWDWFVGVVGTLLPLLLRPGEAPGPFSWFGQPLQVLGLVAAVAGLASLGRSFGIVAANRGVKTSGLYRTVRHPAYAGYLLGYLGYVISYPTPSNGVIAFGTLLALNARAIIEERFLARDPRYRDYLNGTRWRFVPYLY